MKKIIVILLLIFATESTFAQELRCMIQVNHSQIQGTNVLVFQEMQRSIYEFMNDTRWTDHVYTNDERIECTMMIQLTEQIGSERFVGTISVQSSRPVYGTTYNTTILNFQEQKGDFRFKYIEQQPLEFNENTHISELTSVLAFYAYVILGLDYDTFLPNGGKPFFAKAQKIVNNAQNSPEPGWKSYESRKNRYWLVENLTNESYSDLHTFLYQYHRQGLDLLGEKPDEARATIATSLEYLRKVYQKKPDIFILPLILSSKSNEIVKIFSESYPREQAEVVNIMQIIDPANSSKYQKITQSN
jgi:hypothetical protein